MLLGYFSGVTRIIMSTIRDGVHGRIIHMRGLLHHAFCSMVVRMFSEHFTNRFKGRATGVFK